MRTILFTTLACAGTVLCVWGLVSFVRIAGL
jgi:hypothetical protein